MSPDSDIRHRGAYSVVQHMFWVYIGLAGAVLEPPEITKQGPGFLAKVGQHIRLLRVHGERVRVEEVQCLARV